jgi:hypothetical protein
VSWRPLKGYRLLGEGWIRFEARSAFRSGIIVLKE